MMSNAYKHPLLHQLADIQQPVTVSWWPLAPVWWFVLLLLLFLFIFAVYFWLRYTRLRREALAELASIYATFHRDRAYNQLAMNITILLRRVALAKFPLPDVAGLSGYHWLDFLDQHGNTDAFTRGTGAILEHAPYQTETRFDSEALFQLTRQWIKVNT